MSKPITEWTSPNEIRSHLIRKAADDSDFRADLLADPKAAVSAELDVDIPDGLNISVVEDSPTVVHLVLPPNPQLTSEDLKAISGGECYGYWEGYDPP